MKLFSALGGRTGKLAALLAATVPFGFAALTPVQAHSVGHNAVRMEAVKIGDLDPTSENGRLALH